MTSTIKPTQAVSAEEFADRVFGAAFEAADVFAIYLGEKLGLYQALAEHGPLTRDELTRRATIHWRYAQEWLEQQTVSGILVAENADDGPAERRYALPQAHGEVLLDRDSLLYLAPLIRVVLSGGLAMPELVEAYRTGTGVSWADFGEDARTGQADMNRPWFLKTLGEEWFPAVPDLDAALRAGGRVADFACGEGWASIGIALAYPDTVVDGFDVDGPSIEAARRHAAEYGVADRVSFHQVDAADLDREGVYDAVVGFEFLHDLPHPVQILETMRKVAREDAPVVLMDENVPDRFTGERNEVERAMYGFSILVCLPDGMSHQPSAATGTVIRADTVREYARQAGFQDVEILPIENDLWRFYRLTH